MVLIRSVSISNVAPIRHIEFETASRLNLFCGDNGVGKSFILDAMWWTTYRNEPQFSAFPTIKNGEVPEISIRAESPKPVQISQIFQRARQSWQKYQTDEAEPTGGLSIYLRTNGDCVFWDSLRDIQPYALALTRDQILNGREESETRQRIINGLIDDWVLWQRDPDKRKIEIFEKVLRRLSPSQAGDIGPLKLGEPRKISTTDVRLHPTVKHEYGEIPVIYASAGVQRILSLAYLIVWLWTEHCSNAALTGTPPQLGLQVYIDEIESHLHPQWQRVILPKVLEVGEDLSNEVTIQFFITTHSPLVLASLEPHFDEERDKLFHLDLVHKNSNGSEVELEPQKFIKHGTADSWLTSETFELGAARSIEAEKAIREAVKLQQQARPKKKDVKRVHEDLCEFLGDGDRFWVRWIAFAERHGVTA